MMNDLTKLSGLFTPQEVSDLMAYCQEKVVDPLEAVREAVLEMIAR
jgi:hypothetical protein